MKLNDYRINKKESIECLYENANRILEEQLLLIENSDYDLFFDFENLKKSEIRSKYLDLNNRAFLLGLACEYFLKYMLMCGKSKTDPNISLHDIWNNRSWPDKIRTHEIINLFNLLEHTTPGFSRTALQVMNHNSNINSIIEDNINIYNFDSENYCMEPRAFLLPNFNSEIFSTEELIEDFMTEYSSIFITSRYSMEEKRQVNLDEILALAKNLQFLSEMIHINNNDLDINSNNNKMLFIKANLKNPVIYKDILKYRSEDEINELLKMNIVGNDPDLLYLALSVEQIDINLIRQANKVSKDRDEFMKNIYILSDGEIEMYDPSDDQKNNKK